MQRRKKRAAHCARATPHEPARSTIEVRDHPHEHDVPNRVFLILGRAMTTFIRDARRKLRFKRVRFETAVMAFIFERMQSLTLDVIDDEDKKREEQLVHQKNNHVLRGSFESGLFTSVGRALSAWAGLEQCLVSTTAGLLFTTEKKAGIVMHSIINFGAWLGIMGELFVEDELFAHLKPKWDKLSSRLRALKDMRDRIAHHSVFSVDTPFAMAKLTGLKPSPFDGRSKSRKQQSLDSYQIDEFYHAIGDAVRDLKVVADEIDAITAAEYARLAAKRPADAAHGT